MIFQFSCFECFVFYITKLTIMFDSQFYSKMVVKSNCLFKKFSETKKPKVSTCLYLLYLSIYGTACIKNIKSIVFCLPIYYVLTFRMTSCNPHPSPSFIMKKDISSNFFKMSLLSFLRSPRIF